MTISAGMRISIACENPNTFCLSTLWTGRIFHDQTELNALEKTDASAEHGLISNQVFHNF